MLGVDHPVLPALTADGVRDVAAGAAALGSFAALSRASEDRLALAARIPSPPVLASDAETGDNRHPSLEAILHNREPMFSSVPFPPGELNPMAVHHEPKLVRNHE